jgi:hypothetical protein
MQPGVEHEGGGDGPEESDADRPLRLRNTSPWLTFLLKPIHKWDVVNIERK